MNLLFRKAVSKADEVRRKLGLDIFQSINIFDASLDLGLTVRFVDINMEGTYFCLSDGRHPTIALSNQRPLQRRVYTCAHELGHHVFGHGTKIDLLTEQETASAAYDSDEYLVDIFAGALLLPIAGIQAEFAIRGWSLQTASPIQFYTICSIFGTGYSTIVNQCRANKIISIENAAILQKQTPAKLLIQLLGSNVPATHFKIIDEYSNISVVDLEVSNYIILPKKTQIEGSQLQVTKETSVGQAYLATNPGIVRVILPDTGNAFFIRIQNMDYIGLAEYRHLEN